MKTGLGQFPFPIPLTTIPLTSALAASTCCGSECRVPLIAAWPRYAFVLVGLLFPGSIVIQPTILRIATAACAAFRSAHEITQQVAHVGFDLFRVLTGFEAFDGDVEFPGN